MKVVFKALFEGDGVGPKGRIEGDLPVLPGVGESVILRGIPYVVELREFVVRAGRFDTYGATLAEVVIWLVQASVDTFDLAPEDQDTDTGCGFLPDQIKARER